MGPNLAIGVHLLCNLVYVTSARYRKGGKERCSRTGLSYVALSLLLAVNSQKLPQDNLYTVSHTGTRGFDLLMATINSST